MSNLVAQPPLKPWTWRPGQTVPRVSHAVINGTPQLDTVHRATLLVYVRSLDPRRLDRGDARVRLDPAVCASRLKAAPRDIRWHLQNLQSAGYLAAVPRARPGAREVYDLAPTLARLEAMEALAAAGDCSS